MLDEEKSRQIELACTNRACMMLVCINGHKDNLPYGRIVNYQLSKSVGFIGLDQLLLGLDEVCERLGAPMATTDPRFLQKERERQYKELREKPRENQDRIKIVKAMFPYMADAKKAIMVHVMFRQHSSMQGRLQCSYTGEHSVSFRSALELLRMLDEINTYMCQNLV